MAHSMGHDVLSDFGDRPFGHPLLGLYKNCGFWTHDEAAILYNIARQLGGGWLDLGAHTGWTAAHQAAAGCSVTAVDNMLPIKEFAARFEENIRFLSAGHRINAFAGSSDEFFAQCGPALFSGVVVDADHCHPHPQRDAENAMAHLRENGVILFHDFIGEPVRRAVTRLLDLGFACRVYWTPHMVACCWRGEVIPPKHARDPKINWEPVERSMPDFDFARCTL